MAGIANMVDIADKIGKLVNFEIYPSSRFPERFEKVVIEALVSAKDIPTHEPAYNHRIAYPSLPTGVKDDPYSYMWVKVRFRNGSFRYIGLTWIDPETISLVANQSYTIVVTDDRIDAETELRNVLQAAGFTSLTITSN